MWLFIFFVVAVIVALIILSPGDPNLVKPCPKCGSQMKHLPGEESPSTAEARFGCTQCDHEEYRGGYLSEWMYENH